VKTLIYKQTSLNDPGVGGVWGIRDCMGRIRSRNFEAVIAYGGKGSFGIDGRITWIGLGAYPLPLGSAFNGLPDPYANLRAPLIAFKHFMNFGNSGPQIRVHLPDIQLPHRSPVISTEVDFILAMAFDAPKSPWIKKLR
jgi:hypothetical protein